MELDWCENSDTSITSQFNEKSIIGKDKIIKNNIQTISNIVAENCFSQNLNINDRETLLTILNYLSIVSNHLRINFRGRSNYKNIILLSESNFDDTINYLNWILTACDTVKTYFVSVYKRDITQELCNIKLFKTSSYKFCNYKDCCPAHKNKSKTCDKNHYVFDMIILDIQKLIFSLQTIGYNNINWLLNNKILLITFNPENSTYIIENNNNISTNLKENQFYIDKTLVFKSFDVISFVLNKMYEETIPYLSSNTNSFLINFN